MLGDVAPPYGLFTMKMQAKKNDNQYFRTRNSGSLPEGLLSKSHESKLWRAEEHEFRKLNKFVWTAENYF